VKGSGLAIGGIATGLISGVLGLVSIPLTIWLVSEGAATVEKGRAAADAEAAKTPENIQSRHNLRQIGIAFHNYEAAHGHLPPAVVYDKDGRPLYSWRVLLLPYLEQEPLFRAFRFDEPWDSPHNIQFARQTPSVYAHPGAPQATAAGLTYYQVFVSDGNEPLRDQPIFTRKRTTRQVGGTGQPLRQPVFASESVRLTQIRDGSSNTILLAEAANPVPWSKPDDMNYSPKLPVPGLGLPDRKRYNVVMADGAVLDINPARLPDETLRRVITANDGNIINDWPPP
jgi:hypothetical protein